MKIYNSPTPELNLKRPDGQMRKIKIKTSDDAAIFFREIFDKELIEICESMMVLYLNNSNNTVGWFKASQGGITGTVVDVRIILKKALDCYATGMIICHNHPSGKLNASNADIDITKKLKQACEILDIRLQDHIILAPINSETPEEKNYYSFLNEGLL